MDDDELSHYFGVQGAIDVEELTDGVDADQPPGRFIPLGAPVTWTYDVTNTDNSQLTNVGVVDTTQIYLHAHLALKERALARTAPPNTPPGRYRPARHPAAFLEAL